jgi:hypothetical protein
MAVNNYGDIPDDFPTKKHLPLGSNIWGMFKLYGWEWLQHFFKEFGRTIGDLAKIRLTESIFTAREVVSGKIPEEEASKTLTYCFFPPTMAIRADLQQGTMKLLFGESSDTTFLFLDDFDKDILFALNTHIEDGYPVDYWHIISGEDDDFFDRRHMKLGYKFRNIPKKSKTLDQAAERLIDVLKDARNERTPKWNTSAYHIIITWCSAGLNMVMENSNFETIGCMFDGLASKMFYGLKNFWFNFVPVPTFIGSMARMDRQKFLKMFGGLTCESKLYLQPVEEEAHPLVKEIVPECFDFMRKRWLKGIILPWQTLGREIPKLKKLKSEEEFSHQYPDDPNGRLKGEEIGLNFDDSLKGNYLDVSWDKKREDITSNDVISSGHGRETVFKK